MKIIYYREGTTYLPGILTDKGVIKIPADSLSTSAHGQPLTLDQLNILRSAIDPANATYLDEASLEIGPCAPFPQKIICIGLNYRKHAEESNMPIPTVPIVFSKFANTLISYGEDVALDTPGLQNDYEVELGVIIGRECRNVSTEEALSFVAGYCTANDMSCRDLQFMTSQWLLGKTSDNFLPLGKYMLTADEVPDPQDLNLTCHLNGELRQSSTTADMVFTVAEIISFLSRYFTLAPGDLILTGTPSGVIMGMQEKNWLKPGDVVRVEIDKLGFTENRMVGKS